MLMRFEQKISIHMLVQPGSSKVTFIPSKAQNGVKKILEYLNKYINFREHQGERPEVTWNRKMRKGTKKKEVNIEAQKRYLRKTFLIIIRNNPMGA